MSNETSYLEAKQLDSSEPSPYLYASEYCGSVYLETLDTEKGTLNESGGTSLFGEALTDQSGNPLLT